MTTPDEEPGKPEEKQPPELPAAPPVSPDQGTPDDRPDRKMLILGLVIGVVLYAVGYAITLSGGMDSQQYWALGYAAVGFLLTLVLLVIGLVTVFIRQTRDIGAGLLISVAIGVLCGGGVCVALLQAQSI